MNGDSAAELVQPLRPFLWPAAWLHCLTGFIIASGRGALHLPAETWLTALVAGGLWAALLGGAATALAALFAVDLPAENAEAGTPEAVGWIAATMLVLGMILSPAVGWHYFEVYLTGILFLVAYATPPVRLGRFRVGWVALPALGYGALTLYAGWVAMRPNAVALRHVALYLAGFALLVAALRLLYWMTDSRLLWLLYALCVMGAFACLGTAGMRLSRQGWTLALLAPSLAACTLLGTARFLNAGQRARVPRLALTLAAWILADLGVAVSALLG